MLAIITYLGKLNRSNNYLISLTKMKKLNNGCGLKIFEPRLERIREFSTTYRGAAFKLSDIGSKEELKYYHSIQPQLVDDISTMFMQNREVIGNYKNVLTKTSLYYSHNYGFLTSHAYKVLVPIKHQTKENYFLASVLGWCVDLLNLSLILYDDIIDNSEFRGKLISWHKREDVGLRAIIDIQLIQNGSFLLLKKYFYSEPTNVRYFELFCEVYTNYALSCQLDFKTESNREPMIRSNTTRRYTNLVLSQTSYPSVILPLLIMNFVKRDDPTLIAKIKLIACKLSEYMTAQDDVIACFGDITGPNNDHGDNTRKIHVLISKSHGRSI